MMMMGGGAGGLKMRKKIREESLQEVELGPGTLGWLTRLGVQPRLNRGSWDGIATRHVMLGWFGWVR